MRSSRVSLLCAVTLAVAASCSSDSASTPRGPITLAPTSYIFTEGLNNPDTVFGTVSIDGGAPIRIWKDSATGFPRGRHSFKTRLDIEYISDSFAIDVNPNGNRTDLFVDYAFTCRSVPLDASICANRSAPTWSGSNRLLCRVNDFGDFCSGYPDALAVGARWPVDNDSTVSNTYITQAKLLIGAIMGSEIAGSEGDTLAMSLVKPGDYGPRTRLRVVSGDSSRWQARVWTDLRRQPFFGFPAPFLAYADRAGNNFGLEVLTTYELPSALEDVLVLRFDVRNISNDPDYRLVHPEIPVGGITLTQIYLAPVVNADIGGGTVGEAIDDNGVIFGADSLVAAYDQEFSAASFSPNTRTRPGLVGLRLISAPAPARAIVGDIGDSLTFTTNATEDNTYRIFAGTSASCTNNATSSVCAPETENDVRIGWSVGPIASLAPGQSVTLTVAIVLAYPKAGAFTTGTAYAPNDAALAAIAEPLRALAAQLSGRVVNNAP